MVFRRRKITDRVQTLVDEVLYMLQKDTSHGFENCPPRTVQAMRLEERVLMSASPVAMIAEATTAVMESGASLLGAQSDDLASEEPVAENQDSLIQVGDEPISAESASALMSDQSAVDDYVPDATFANSEITTESQGLEHILNLLANGNHAGVEQTANDSDAAPGPELVVIDYRVQDSDTVLESLLTDGRDVRLLRLTGDDDGLTQITNKLEQIGNVSAIHLLTHGSDGEILLGATVLNNSTLAQHAPELLAWQHSLTADADILLYGCDVAETTLGRDFVDSLAVLTQTDVAASTDETGNTSLGGNWNLEYVEGAVEATTVFRTSVAQDWNGLLSITLADTNEFAVNTTATNTQNTSAETRGSQQAVSLAADGSYVVVWSSLNQDGSGWGVYARRFDSTGTALTAEILVSQTTNGDQEWARVVSADDGSFVVTWTGGATGSEDVYFRRFAANGTAVGGEVLANDSTTGIQKNSVIAMDQTTNQFVIAWQGEGPNDTSSIFFRRFNSTGIAQDSTDQLVNTAGANSEQDPAIAMQTGGGFVIAYERGNSNKVYFQRFNGGGGKVGSETQIDNLLSTSSRISIASDAAGNFTVAYREQSITTGIWTKNFNADGTESHTWSRIATGDAVSSSVAMLDDGSYIVTWQESGDDDGVGIFARRFNADASSNGDEFLVNQTTAGVQSQPSVAALDANSFVIVWSGQGTGDAEGIFARQFNLTVPSLDLDANNNSGATGNNFQTSYTDGLGPVAVVDADATLSDIDSVNLSSLTITITDRQNGNNEILAATTAGTSITAVYTNGTLTLTGSDTVANYQQVLRTVTYNNLQNPGTGSSRTITFVASDGVNSSLAATTSLSLTTAPNLAPVITSNGGGATATISVAENTTAVTTVTATDTNIPVQTLTYSITGGADAGRFSINSTTGELRFAVAPNFELATDAGTNNVYDVIVQVTDGTSTDSQSIAVTVTNVNEAPTANAGGPYTIVAGNSLTLNGSGSSDPESNSLTYRWDLDGDGIFGESGEPTTQSPTISWATLQSFGIHTGANTIGLQVNDGNGGLNSTTVTLTVTGSAVALTPVADTHIDISGNTNNFGASTSLIVKKDGGGIGNNRALLRFDLSSIPSNATITGATLKLNATSNSAAFNINVYELTQAWDEGAGNASSDAASWNDRLDGVTWTSSGGTFNSAIVATLNTSSTGIHSWNIASLVQAWANASKANNGLILGSPDLGNKTVVYDSKEGGTPPVLEITYTVPQGAPTVVAGGPLTNAEGGTLTLNGSSSSDPNSDPLTYEWDLNYSGNFNADATGVNPTLNWAALQAAGINDSGTYQIALRVHDGSSYSTIAQQALTVSNVAPTLNVTGATTAVSGSTYTLNLNATDPGNDTITSWTINWGDGSVQTVTGNPSSVSHVYSNSGFTNSITVSATDEDGFYTPSDLYVTSFATNQLVRFDGVTGEKLSTAFALTNPAAVVFGPDGLMYVAQFGSNDIDRFDATTGNFVDTFVYGNSAGLTEPSRLAFGADGNLYVSSQATGEILSYSGSDGRFLGIFVAAGSGGLSQPDGITFGPDGNLYVASFADGTIRKYDGRTGSSLGTFASLGTSTYIDLHFAPNGNLLASSTTLNVIREFNGTTGAFVRDLVAAGSGGLVSAGGFTVAPDGSVVVVDFGGDRILRYSSTGTFLDEFAGTVAGLDQPVAPVFTPSLQVTVNAPPIAADDSFTLNEGGSLNLATTANWFNSNWGSRTQITYDGTPQSADLNNFQVLVKLHATASDAVHIDYSKTQNAGEDLRFVDASGNVLVHEIESWDESGYSYVWVRIPVISSGTTGSMHMYYDNPDAVDGSTASAVWESNDIAVLHLNGNTVDSTSASNDGSLVDVYVTPGITGNAALFNGITSSVNMGSTAAVDNIFAGGGTISAWINPTGWGEGGYGRIADKAVTTFGPEGNGDGWAWQVGGSGSSGYLLFEQGFTGGISEWKTPLGSLNLNTWQQVVIVYDSSSASNTPQFYINGVLQTLITNSTGSGTARSDAALDLFIGNHAGIRTFDGRIDEVRLTDGRITANEIAAQYRTVMGTQLSQGATQSGSGGLLANDSDLDSDKLAVSLVSGPAHAVAGSFVLNSDGSFTYTHDGSETATDSFTYAVSDGLSTRQATVSLNITLVNDNAPQILSNGGGPTAAVTIGENSTNVTAIAATDADITSAPLVYSISGGADAARFTINSSTGQLQFITAPDADAPNDSGSNNVYDVIVQVSDGTFVDTQAISVSVSQLNDNSPVITSNGGGATATISVPENTTAVTTVIATDLDLPSSALSYSISGGADAARFTINSSTGQLQFVTAPDADAPTDSGSNNVYDVIVRVSDGTFVDTQAISVTVSPLNDNSPVITSNGGGATATISVPENSTAVTTVTATDLDLPSSALIYSISGGADAARFSITSSTGQLQFITAPDAEVPTDSGSNNVYDVIVQVSDGTLVDTQAISVTVSPLNDNSPVITSNGGGATVTIAVSENTTAVTTVTATDLDLPSSALTYSISGGASASSFSINSATGVLRFLVAPNFEAPTDNDGDNVYSVRVRVSDGINTTSQLILVSVQDVNEVPVASGEAFSVQEDTTLIVPVAGVLANDSDVDGDTLTAILVDDVRHGALILNSDGQFSYTPDADFNGLDTFTYRSYDGNLLSNLVTVSISVSAVNDAPVISLASDTIVYYEQNAAIAIDPGLTVRDIDNGTLTGATVTMAGTSGSNEDQLVFTAVSGITGVYDSASHVLTLTGTASVAAYETVLRSVQFQNLSDTPDESVRTVTIQVSDGSASSLASRDLRVIAVNDAPVITSDGGVSSAQIRVMENTTFVTTVTSSDVDSATATYSIAGGIDEDFFTINAVTGELHFLTPPDFDSPADSDQNNAYVVRIRVTDENGGRVSQTLVVKVVNINEAPTSTAIADVLIMEDAAPFGFDVSSSFVDPDHEALAYKIESITPTTAMASLFDSVTINAATGVITFDTTTNAFGSAVVVVTGTDRAGLSSTEQFTITVQAVNDAPVVRRFSGSTISGQSLSISGSKLLQGASDVEGDAIRAVLVRAPANGVVTVNGDGSFLYQPNVGYFGTDTFLFAGTDGMNIGTAVAAAIDVQPPFATQASSTGSSSSSTTSTKGTSQTTTNSTTTQSTTTTHTNTAQANGTQSSSSAGTSTSDSASAANTSGPVGVNLNVNTAPATQNENNDDEIIGLLPQNKTAAENRLNGNTSSSEAASASSSDREAVRRHMAGDAFGRNRNLTASDWDTRSALTPLELQRQQIYRELAANAQEQINFFEEKLTKNVAMNGRVVGSVGVVTTGFSVGYLIWAVRGGMLLSGVLSQIPAWTMLDPLMVIDGDNKDDDKESLQTIMDRQQEKLSSGSRSAASPVNDLTTKT